MGVVWFQSENSILNCRWFGPLLRFEEVGDKLGETFAQLQSLNVVGDLREVGGV